MILDRTKRIKDAKSEAHKEIEEYRQQKEEEFKKFEGEVRNSTYVSLMDRWSRRLTGSPGNSTRADSRRPKKTRARKPRQNLQISRPLAASTATRWSMALSMEWWM